MGTYFSFEWFWSNKQNSCPPQQFKEFHRIHAVFYQTLVDLLNTLTRLKGTFDELEIKQTQKNILNAKRIAFTNYLILTEFLDRDYLELKKEMPIEYIHKKIRDYKHLLIRPSSNDIKLNIGHIYQFNRETINTIVLVYRFYIALLNFDQSGHDETYKIFSKHLQSAVNIKTLQSTVDEINRRGHIFPINCIH